VRFSLSRDQFLFAVQRCYQITGKRNVESILANLLLEAEGSTLTISATDNEMSLSMRVEAQVIEKGRTTVSARKLFEILKELSKHTDVEINTDANFLKLKSGLSHFRLATISPETFPQSEPDAVAVQVQIGGGCFASLIAATSFAMSLDETRDYLTGTCFDIQKGQIRLIATDTHRLAFAYTDIDNDLTHSSLVPRKTMLELRRLLDGVRDTVDIYLSKRQFLLTTPTMKLSSKLIDKRFPPYEAIVFVQYPHQAIANCSALDQATRRSMIISNEKTHDVKLSFEQHVLRVETINQNNQEESVEQIDIAYEGPAKTVFFNGRYLLDIFNQMHADSSVSFQFTEEFSSMLITEVGVEASRYIVMPMDV